MTKEQLKDMLRLVDLADKMVGRDTLTDKEFDEYLELSKKIRVIKAS